MQHAVGIFWLRVRGVVKLRGRLVGWLSLYLLSVGTSYTRHGDVSSNCWSKGREMEENDVIDLKGCGSGVNDKLIIT